MPLEELAAQPYVQKESLVSYICELAKAKVDKNYSGFSPQPVTSFLSNELSHIYLNKQDLN